MLVTIGAVLLLLVTLPVIWWFLYLYKVRSFLDLPGPKPLPVLGNVLDLGSNPCDLLNNMQKYCKEFNGIYRIFTGPDIRVVFSRPELMEPLLTSSVNISKTSGYDLARSWLGNGLLLSTGDKWRSRRKLIGPAFHLQNLEKSVTSFDTNAAVLVQQLAQQVDNNGVDIKPYISNYALDVLCDSLMGVNLKCQENENKDFVEAVRNYMDILIIRFFSLWERFEPLFKFSKLYVDYRKSVNILHAFSTKVICSKPDEGQGKLADNQLDQYGSKTRAAFLDMLLKYKQSNNLSDEDVREEIDTFIFTGHDTVSSSITFTLYALANHPHIQTNVHKEIVQVFGNSKNSPVTIKQINELTYLDMVIKEAMRLYTTIPLTERKLDEDIVIEGRTYPAGTSIGMFLYGMHNSEEFYAEPEKFDPSRFLPENVSKRHKFAYLPFSTGPRNCIGRKYAMLETKVVVTRILQNFDLQPAPGFELFLGMAAVLQSYNGVYIQIKHRR